MIYRKEIDGLRAIAVLPVIFYHSGLSLFKGGFIGVDIFFVISGFLITSIILNQTLESKFSFLKFYEKRARRILPPLIITVLTTFILSLILLVPAQIKNVGQSLVSISLFISNYFFYLETDYFNSFNEVNPLLHTWSLSLEEQFYIFFPILFYLTILGFKKATNNSESTINYTFIVIFILALISFITAIDLGSENNILAFYALQSRGWELLLGSLCALLNRIYQNNFIFMKKKVLKNFILYISFLILIMSFFMFNKNTVHPGYFTLLPVITTSIVILFSGGNDIVTKILHNKFLIEIGLISYALYLFHNPIFSFITIFFENSKIVSTSIKLFSIIPIFYLSKLSLKYVENPFRVGKNFSQKKIFFLSILSISFMFGVGYISHKTTGFEKQYLKLYDYFGMKLLVDEESELKLISEYRDKLPPHSLKFEKSLNNKKVLIIGDSFGEDTYFSLMAIKNKDYQFRFLRFDDDYFNNISNLKNFEEWGDKLKLYTNKNNASTLIQNADIIIISCKWQESTYSPAFDIANIMTNELAKEVYIVSSIVFTRLSSISIKKFLFRYSFDELPKIIYNNQRWDRKRISDKLKDLVLRSDDERLHWIEKSDFFNDEKMKTSNLFYEDKKPKIWDNAHLTARAYIDFGNFMLNMITYSK